MVWAARCCASSLVPKSKRSTFPILPFARHTSELAVTRAGETTDRTQVCSFASHTYSADQGLRLECRNMFARGIISNVLVIASALCILAGSLIRASMIKQVNARLPEEQRFSYVGASVQWMLSLVRGYRRFFPDGKMYVAMKRLVMLAVLCALCYLILLLF